MNLPVALLLLANVYHFSEGSPPALVTCGSTIKLLNTRHDVRLHSHEVNYGGGSGQQSVTGVQDAGDVNSYWALRGHMQKPCARGEPIKCGDVVRLQHLKTKVFLHSHLVKAPLSNGQEVSGYTGADGNGDSGDHWVVQCSSKQWRKTSQVQLKHVDTAKYLHVSGQKFNRPIAGQFEISAADLTVGDVDWKVMEGVLLQPTQKS